MKLFYVLCACSCLVLASGCSTTSKLISYTQSNPLLVDIATKQAVFRYIDAGDTPELKIERAAKVTGVLNKVESFLEGNPTANSRTLFLVVKTTVDLEKLELRDRLLVEDILTVIEMNIERSQEAGSLDPDAVIRIRVLIRTLIRTAALFQ